MKWFLNLLTGGLLDRLTTLGTVWLGKRNERIRIEREMYGDRVRAEIVTKQLAANILIAEQGWWVTRMIRPAFAYPLVAYWGAHILRSLYFHEWEILPLPEFMQEWAGWIVAAFFLMRPIEKLGKGVGSHLKDWLGRTLEGMRARQKKAGA